MASTVTEGNGHGDGHDNGTTSQAAAAAPVVDEVQEARKSFRKQNRDTRTLDERKLSMKDLDVVPWGAARKCYNHKHVDEYKSIEKIPPLPVHDTERNVYAKWTKNRWVQLDPPWHSPVWITHCNSGGGNCFFCATAHIIYGSDRYWPYVKAELLIWHTMVLEDKTHPRHLLYKAIEEDALNDSQKNATVLHQANAWTVAACMGQVVADLYDIFLVLFDFDHTDNSNFPSMELARGATSSKVSTFGCSNAEHKFLGFTNNNHYEPVLPFVPRPSEYKLITDLLPTTSMIRRKSGSVVPERLIPRPVPRHTRAALETVIGVRESWISKDDPDLGPGGPPWPGKRPRDDDDDDDNDDDGGAPKKPKLAQTKQQSASTQRETDPETQAANRLEIINEKLKIQQEEMAAKEAKLKAKDAELKARQADIDEQDQEITSRMISLGQLGPFYAQRASNLDARTAALNQREVALHQRDTALTQRNVALNQREAALNQREAALNQREAALNQRQSDLTKAEADSEEKKKGKGGKKASAKKEKKPEDDDKKDYGDKKPGDGEKKKGNRPRKPDDGLDQSNILGSRLRRRK